MVLQYILHQFCTPQNSPVPGVQGVTVRENTYICLLYIKVRITHWESNHHAHRIAMMMWMTCLIAQICPRGAWWRMPGVMCKKSWKTEWRGIGGRKERGEWEPFDSVWYINNYPESTLEQLCFGKEFKMERIVNLNGPMLGISSKCGFSPILFSAINIRGSARSGAEQVFTGSEL